MRLTDYDEDKMENIDVKIDIPSSFYGS